MGVSWPRAPEPGSDVRELWKNVADCVGLLEAIKAVKIRVDSKELLMEGHLNFTGSSCQLVIRENKEVGG